MDQNHTNGEVKESDVWHVLVPGPGPNIKERRRSEMKVVWIVNVLCADSAPGYRDEIRVVLTNF